jgi:hypothetical protein
LLDLSRVGFSFTALGLLCTSCSARLIGGKGPIVVLGIAMVALSLISVCVHLARIVVWVDRECLMIPTIYFCILESPVLIALFLSIFFGIPFVILHLPLFYAGLCICMIGVNGPPEARRTTDEANLSVAHRVAPAQVGVAGADEGVGGGADPGHKLAAVESKSTTDEEAKTVEA